MVKIYALMAVQDNINRPVGQSDGASIWIHIWRRSFALDPLLHSRKANLCLR